MDVLLISPEWPLRALLRAQLLDQGYTVLAVDAWPVPGHDVTPPRIAPRAVIVDLQRLDDPRRILTELARFVPPQRVIALTALGTLSTGEVQGMGFTAIARPVRIAEVVAAATQILAPEPGDPPRP